MNKNKLSPKAMFIVISLFLYSSIPLFLFPSPVLAQQTQLDLTVSPLFLDLIGQANGVIKDKVRVRNNSDTSLPLKVEVKKLVSAGELGESTLADPGPGDDFVNWVKLDNTSFSARPKEWTDINFTLTIPQQAAFGYYLAFVISQDTEAPDSPRTTKVTGGVAVPILINIKSEGAKAEAKLLDFKPKSFINEYLPVEFQVRVANTGNVHIKPRGNIFVRGSGERDLGILEVNEAMGNVLPGGTRSFDTSWADGFITLEPVVENDKVKLDNKGNPQTRLNIHWNKITDMRLGRYTAYLLMVFDDGKRDVTMEQTTSFWVIPYRLIGGVIIFVLIAIFLLRAILGMYIRKEARKYR